MHIFDTERLSLREATAGDAAFVLELINTPAWHRHIGDYGIRRRDQAEAYIEERFISRYRSSGFASWLVERSGDRVPVGICGLVKRDSLPHPDLGFALLPRFEGQGYAFEAARGTLGHAFGSLGLPAVLAFANPENEASIRLIGKLGMTPKGSITIGNETRSVMLFERLRDQSS